jgi:hypothetical protein
MKPDRHPPRRRVLDKALKRKEAAARDNHSLDFFMRPPTLESAVSIENHRK